MRARRLAITVHGVAMFLLALGFGHRFVQAAPQNFPVAAAVNGNDDRVVPIDDEPRHHKVYDSGTTRVLDVQVPAGDMTLFHTHRTVILYVPISRSQTRTQVFGEDWRGGTATAAPLPPGSANDRPGTVTSNTTYIDKPFTHRLHNFGDNLYRLFAVVNLSAGSESETDDVSGLSAKPELVNRWYRAHRVVLAAGESSTLHRHTTPVVVVQQTAGRVVSEGSAKRELSAPAMFSVHDGPGMHHVRNTGTGPVDVIEVEVRGATTK